MIYSCCNLNRKNAILANPAIGLNGIDYLEVLGLEVSSALGSPPQQTLLIYCLNALPTTFSLSPSNLLIVGGESITQVAAVWVAPASAPPAAPKTTAQEQKYFATLSANVLVVRTNKAGDFSTYQLRLVNNAVQAAEDPFAVTEVLTGFDPQLAEVSFSFKVECGPDFDCGPQTSTCSQTPLTPPPINYLAKDYGSFRTLILDRLNQLLPNWGASSEADLGIVLAELIAYAGDHLSYQQDAVATEAYLETARSRISLRRHALLVDYHVHDGCNARTWIQVQVGGTTGQGVFLDRTLTRFYTYAPGMPASLAVGAGNEEAALSSGVQVFEPMQDALLYLEHNQMSFYTWGNVDCCLPAGATEATLKGSYPTLQPGDVLIFQEVLGPQTGNAADADLRHRCAVRLTQVAIRGAKGQPLVDPLFSNAAVTEIQWSQADAPLFPVCISSTYTDANGSKTTVTDVSVVYGNVVLADHGLSISGKTLGTVPPPRILLPPSPTADRCQMNAPTPLPVRFRPPLPDSPLTQAVPVTMAGSPVTPGVVLLGGVNPVSLTDSDGVVCLMVGAADPLDWPQLFGVLVTKNATTPANFDLSVVYNPPGGAVGIGKQVTVESFPNLSLTTTDPHYVVTQINTLSRLIQVPSSYAPPKTAPAGFPTAPTMLSNTGAINLQDTSSPAVTYLTVQATSPIGWLQDFGVLVNGSEEDGAAFDLAVVYSPPSSGVGVPPQVIVEQFTNLSLATMGGQFNLSSQLVTIKNLAQAPDPSLSAHDLLSFDPAEAVPEISLQGTFDGATSLWSPEQDLLENTESDQVFVVEIESNGSATLRFATPADPNSTSEQTNGMVPEPSTTFVANYRIGNGSAGNVGAGSLSHLAAGDARILTCTNPLAASGGTDPETNDQIRRRAPQAYLAQERSVTMADYEDIAETNSQVEQAVASLRWTGSWYSVFIAVEPRGGGNLTPALQTALKNNVERYRLAGRDLKLESPQYLSLQIALQVCVDPNYFQADVQRSLLQVLGNQILPNGQKGFFYPDNFTFGQTVYLSPVYAAARSVAGVISVTATQFQPQGVNSSQYLTSGQIPLGTLQVARLENDPSFPDHGQLTLVMQGGK